MLAIVKTGQQLRRVPQTDGNMAVRFRAETDVIRFNVFHDLSMEKWVACFSLAWPVL